MFATRADIESGLRRFEAARPIDYVLTGMFDTDHVTRYRSALEIPNLGISNTGDSILEPKYIVVPASDPIRATAIPQRRGGVKFVVDQHNSGSSSFLFCPGGMYRREALISGELGPSMSNDTSTELFGIFCRELLKGFTKVKLYHVGPEAMSLLREGLRLTESVTAEKQCDLAIDEALSARRHASGKALSNHARLDYTKSCEELQRLGYLEEGAIPSLRDSRPKHDDREPLGVSFFRTFLTDVALENLTIPRTFFGRSEVQNVSFKGSDLTESNLCWNNFASVDFSNCDLSRSDLRASKFDAVNFRGSNLTEVDLRRSTFRNCDFTNADMRGIKLTHIQGEQLNLSGAQEQMVDWQENDGEQPDGG